MNELSHYLPDRRINPRRIAGLLGLVLLIALAAGYWLWDWVTPRSHLPSSGGIYFPAEKIIPVPQFFQGDPRWGQNFLGSTPATIAAEGCAVSSAAMVLSSYGADVDPGRLNTFVTAHGGFTPEGWLYWEAAAAYPPAIARKAYEDQPSYALIDRNILAGNPVIIRIRLPSGTTHFVVIVGKHGFDYLIRDPAGRGGGIVYPLKDLGCPIEALRFYEKTTPGAVAWNGPGKSP